MEHLVCMPAALFGPYPYAPHQPLGSKSSTISNVSARAAPVPEPGHPRRPGDGHDTPSGVARSRENSPSRAVRAVDPWGGRKRNPRGSVHDVCFSVQFSARAPGHGAKRSCAETPTRERIGRTRACGTTAAQLVRRSSFSIPWVRIFRGGLLLGEPENQRLSLPLQTTSAPPTLFRHSTPQTTRKTSTPQI